MKPFRNQLCVVFPTMADESFERAARCVQSLVELGVAKLLISNVFQRTIIQAVFDTNHDDYEPTLENCGLTRKLLTENLGDLSETLSAASSLVEPDEFGKIVCEQRDEEELGPEDWARRLILVREIFDVDDLRRRVWVKRTAKTEIPGNFEWDVSTKVVDDDYVRPGESPVPYAVIRIGTSAGISGVLSPNESSLTLSLDHEDVRHWIDVLERLDNALSDARV